ncbi:MAG: mechanosensitive ion channel domain-containing protein [Saprospiraceae bacterium]
MFFLETTAILDKLYSALLTFGTAFAILIIGWFIARFLAKMIEKLLKAIKIDTIGDKINDIDILQNANVKILPSILVSRLIYYVLMLLVITAALEVVSLDELSKQVQKLIEYIPKLFSACLILIGGLIVANAIRSLLNAAFQSLNVASGKLISGFIFYFIFVSVLLSALPQANFEVEFLQDNLTIIIGGIVFAFAIGYGFASRNIMSNLLAALYSRNKFQIGDDVKIDGIRGTIIEMDSTSLTLETSDRRVVIPLNQLTTQRVEVFGNWDQTPRIEQ